MSIPASLRKDVCFDIDAAIVFALALLVGLDFFVVCVIYFFFLLYGPLHMSAINWIIIQALQLLFKLCVSHR